MIAVAAIVNQKHSNWTAEFSIGSRSPRGREIVVSSIERRQWSASASLCFCVVLHQYPNMITRGIAWAKGDMQFWREVGCG
jgi:hypothetical protein